MLSVPILLAPRVRPHMEPSTIRLWPCDPARSIERRETLNLFRDASYWGLTLGTKLE
jgi:hypothetical protein